VTLLKTSSSCVLGAATPCDVAQGYASVGAAPAALLEKVLSSVRVMKMSFERKLNELGITLPEAPKPVATYVPAVQAGDLLFLSGVLPFRNGAVLYPGRLGDSVTVEQGTEAAREALLNALAIVRDRVSGLDRVRQIVRLVGYVASEVSFTRQPAVVNGASDTLVAIFGDAGRHARVAVGVAVLPLNACVELEMVVQLQ
jgi:enamine deaminase RidA (YjgF/YER057c/UK114 family)